MQTGDQNNNVFADTVNVDFLIGLDGTDTVQYGNNFADYAVSRGHQGALLVELKSSGTTDLLHDMERLKFADGELAFDTSGIAGKAYRIYQAAFDRVPDAEGLAFWVDQLDAGNVTLNEAAGLFMQSAEFRTSYGDPDTLAYDSFLTLLYNNVLDRAPDADGFAFWQNQAAQGISRAEVITFFSESTENVAKTAGAIADGIWYA